MAAKGHTPKDRLREQMAFNTVNCAALCFFALIALESLYSVKLENY